MRIIAPTLELYLQKDVCLRLTDAAGTTLGSRCGTLWITQCGDGADYVLEPGQAIVLDRNGISLVCPVTDAVLRLDPPSRTRVAISAFAQQWCYTAISLKLRGTWLSICGKRLTLRHKFGFMNIARIVWVSTVIVALFWFAKAANAQDDINPEQYYRLAAEAETERDYLSMILWLNQSAQGGYRPAQELLGIVYLTGQSLYGDAVPINHCEALRWFSRAAAQGSPAGRTLSLLLLRLDRGATVKSCSLN
jgi:hypothetical protein